MKKQKRPKFEIRYRPHPAQSEIHKSKARFKVAVCGRRFGKTTLAIAELVFNAVLNSPSSVNWYVAPTYRQAKQIAWKMLQEFIPYEFVMRKNEMELSITLIPQFGRSTIELKGTDNPDSLRGVGIDKVVLDEYARMKPFVWEEIIRPTLIDTGGSAIFIGTPSGYDHFWRMYMAGQKGNEYTDPDFESWQKETAQNPHIKPSEIAKARQELSEAAFAQEFLADFRANVGKVYKDFDRQVHVITPFEIPSSFTFGRYMDRGFRAPTGVGFVAIDDQTDSLYIIDEIYQTELTNPILAEMIRGKSQNKYFWHSYADSAAASDLADLESLGVYFQGVKKQPGERVGEWIKSGLEKVAQRLKVNPENGKPHLYVFSTCKNHIFEFENYEWDDKRGEDITERPKKRYNHLMDGLRYFLIEYKGGETYGDFPKERAKDWSFR